MSKNRCDPDYMTRAGALLIKKKIEAYWAAAGKEVNTSIEAGEAWDASRNLRYDIRSNMINGRPAP